MTEQEYAQILEKLATYEQMKRQIMAFEEASERLERCIPFALSFDDHPDRTALSLPASRMPDLDEMLIRYFSKQIREYEHRMSMFSLFVPEAEAEAEEEDGGGWRDISELG